MSYNYKDKHCIVAGGAGFIGQNLVNKLVEQGADVCVIDNFSYGASKSNVNERAHIIEGDIRDPGIFQRLPNQHFDYLFNFASPSSVMLFKENPQECLDVTISGFINCFNYCSKQGIKLIYPSSGKVYMGTKPPYSEKASLNYESLDTYAKAKSALEAIAFACSQTCDSLGLRIFAGFGPSEKHKGEHASAIYLFSKEMVAGKSPVVWGDGTQVRDFIYIDDLIEAILILTQNAKESIINVGSGKAVSFNKVIEAINSVLGTKISPVYVEKPTSYAEETLADISIFNNYYQCKRLLEDGISEVVKSLR